MRKSGEIARKFGRIDPQRWGAEWRRLHPVKPVETVAGRLSAPVRTVEKWFDGSCAPSLYWLGEILHAYGPEFLAAGMSDPPPWLERAARQERRARLDDEIAVLGALKDALAAEARERRKARP
jgi:hypothetical protein